MKNGVSFWYICMFISPVHYKIFWVIVEPSIYQKKYLATSFCFENFLWSKFLVNFILCRSVLDRAVWFSNCSQTMLIPVVWLLLFFTTGKGVLFFYCFFAKESFMTSRLSSFFSDIKLCFLSWGITIYRTLRSCLLSKVPECKAYIWYATCFFTLTLISFWRVTLTSIQFSILLLVWRLFLIYWSSFSFPWIFFWWNVT